MRRARGHVPDPIALAGFEATPEGWLRTDPSLVDGGIDGFFIARWVNT